MEDMRNAKQLWSQNLSGKYRLEDLGVDDKILLKLILNK
jgi:hypothetical protein